MCLENPWLRNTPDAPWNEVPEDPPEWFEEYELACDEIGRVPSDFDWDDCGRSQARKQLEEIKRVIDGALEVI